jgi:hypothetical protein
MTTTTKLLRTIAITGIVGVLSVVSGRLAQAENTATMGLAEGTAAQTQCPSSTYLAGFAVQSNGPTMSALAPYCAAMARDGGWEGGAQIYLDRAMSDAAPGSHRLDLFCPLDFYLVAFRGFSQVYGIHSIVQLTLTCKNPKTGAMTAFGTRDTGVSATEWPGAQCADNSVAEGVVGRVRDDQIIQFGFTCAPTRPAQRSAQLSRSAGQLQDGMPNWNVRTPRVVMGVAKENAGFLAGAAAAERSTATSAGSTISARSPLQMATMPQAGGQFAAADPNACQAGYVWRLARPMDLTCVTPTARDRTARENAADASLHNPTGSYGPNTCIAGYVWREAFRGDVVCVTPQTRALVSQENTEGPQHRSAVQPFR